MVIPSSHLRRLNTYSRSATAIHNYFVFFEISSQFTSKIKTFHDNVHKHLFFFYFLIKNLIQLEYLFSLLNLAE